MRLGLLTDLGVPYS